MPAVLIHGVADTVRVWDRVRSHLSRNDVITLALPGFDSPLPKHFTATKEDYVEWIIRQLEEIGEPVDLVGHDWGGIFVMRVVSLRPDLIRSWSAANGPVSRNYEWHALAKVWQTPGEGEQWMQALTPSSFAEILVQVAFPPDLAPDAASHMNAAMAGSILSLYRSAVTVGAEWQPGLDTIRTPGQIIWGKNDTACPVAFGDELGRDAHARRVVKLDANHWVILERGAEFAAALEELWATIDNAPR